MMHLSKTIPAGKETVKFTACQKEFLVMSQNFRDIRSKSKNPIDKCFWCGHHFEDGEMMALAIPEEGVNKVLCQKCAGELLKSQESKERSKEEK